VLSVASRFGRNTRGFSRGAIGLRLGSVVCVLKEARKRWRRAGGMLPCSFWCGAWPGGMQVHGNTLHALRVLGGTVTSGWHGRGGTHGKSRAGLAWGIDPRCPGGCGGEVTGRGMDGGLLALPGCPRRAWRRPGRRGVAGLVLCHAGSGFGC
jgi:hypothetical protein